MNFYSVYYKLYWMWKLSVVSRPYYVIKTFFLLQWNARKTAVMLDDCVRELGLMRQDENDRSLCTMNKEQRNALMENIYYKTLPYALNWRKF